MTIEESRVATSRRQFLATGGMTIAAAYLAPGNLFGQSDNLVVNAFQEAAKAKITVQALRRNVSVLLGAGGNIAVLTGADGKLLVDAEIVTARPQVSEALASINADPIKQLINTHWHFDHTGGERMASQGGSKHSGAREYAEASVERHAGRRDLEIYISCCAGWGYSFHRLQ